MLSPSVMKLCIAVVLFATSMLALGGTIYKSVDANGKTVYSDQPPEKGSKPAKTFNFAELPYTPVPESLTRYRKELEKSLQTRLAAPRNSGAQPILFSAEWCGYCRQAKAYLAEKRIGHQEYDIDTPGGKQAFVEAVGGGGIPVLIRNGQKTQGFSKAAYDAIFSGAQ